MWRGVLGVEGRTELEAGRQFVRRRLGRARQQRAHLVDIGVNEVFGVVGPALGREPATASDHGATHDPGRPDVAENTPFIADLVGEPCLLKEIVELVPVFLGHLGANVGDLVLVGRPVGRMAVERNTHRSEQRVGQLERVATGDVETVDKPVPHEVEVRRHRRADLARVRPQGLEHTARLFVRLEQP